MFHMEQAPHTIENQSCTWGRGLLPITTPPKFGVVGDTPHTKQHASKLMALKFANYVREDRVELGTVAQLVGKGGKIKLVAKNLADDSKRVTVILEKKNGESVLVICSKSVSDGVRSKDITISHLLGFQVTEQLSSTGETINVITMPTGVSGVIEVAVDSTKIQSFEPSSELIPEDLIAF
jgi:hypothetical protein